MSQRISLPIPSDLRFVPNGYLEEWASGGFIESQRCIEIWDYVQVTLEDQSRIGACLTGPIGVGKSAIMYYAVHEARQLGWFVVYIPQCGSWVKIGSQSPAGRYSYFFDAVIALQFVSPAIKTKYAFCFPPNDHVHGQELNLWIS